jgi:NAD+ synthetase
MPVRVVREPQEGPASDRWLTVDAPAVESWLVRFLRDECLIARGIGRAVIGLSGGVDSAVSAFLAAKAFGPENVWAVRMPYKVSSPESLTHARMVVEALGINEETVDITPMVDGYLASEPEASQTRIGNVCARCRMTVLYDQSAKLGALPIGTSNKTERMFGYYTWHADDAPAINPLGDLFKTQVWALARHLGVPREIVEKHPTADLVRGQTDEGDLGVAYPDADRILVRLMRGVRLERLVEFGFDEQKVKLVVGKVAATHWKRKLPTTAMLTDTAINEYYLRPVDL